MTNGELVKILLPLAIHQHRVHKVADVGSQINIQFYEIIPHVDDVHDAILDIVGILPENWPFTNPTQLEEAAKEAGRTEDEHIIAEKLFCRDYLYEGWCELTDKEHPPTVQDIVAFVNMLRSEVREQEKYYGTVSHGGSQDLE